MANPKHLAKLRRDVNAWNRWRDKHTEMVPDLRRAKLAGADLYTANLKGADLRRADLRRANLIEANLDMATLNLAALNGATLGDASLVGANLSEADVSAARFGDADLSGCSFRRAALIATNLSRAKLGGADFDHAHFALTILADNDLSEALGLSTAEHGAPSTIGIDTIYRSQGKIPLAFLRGAGVPENFIEYMGSLTGKSLEFYSCFISYSTKDEEFAKRLHADLQDKGVRCWFAPHDVQGGKKLHEQIDEAIRRYERLLPILSLNSMGSEWVKTEIRKARKRERTEKNRALFPVRLVPFEKIRDWELFDADEGKDLAAEIREYFIPDFSDWKNHAPYTKGFEKLLRDLKTEGSKVT
jgi:hypothetical protein